LKKESIAEKNGIDIVKIKKGVVVFKTFDNRFLAIKNRESPEKRIEKTKFLSDAEPFTIKVIHKIQKPHTKNELKPGKFYTIRTTYKNYLTYDKNDSLFVAEVKEHFMPNQKFFVRELPNNLVLLQTCYGKYLSPHANGSITMEYLEKADGFEVTKCLHQYGCSDVSKCSGRCDKINLKNSRGKILHVNKVGEFYFSDYYRSNEAEFETYKFEKY